MKRHIQFAGAAIVLAALAGGDDLWARGFGGFHAGGMAAGGFHAGGMGAGGFHAGGMGAGGFHAGGGLGGMQAGGFRPGGGDFGGLHSLNPAGNALGGFGANRVGAGGIGAGGFNAGGVGGARIGAGGVGGARIGAGGLSGGRVGDGGVGEGGIAGGPPTRAGLNSFLGLPSDAGLHSVSRAADGFDAASGVARGPLGGVAAGGRVEGPQGGEAGRGVAVGPGGNVVGGRYARGPEGNAVGQGIAAGPGGLRSISAASLNNGAAAVRRSFHGGGLYSGDWYRRYPGAWRVAAWPAGYAWRAATWDALGDWFDYGDAAPIYYDYGTNVVYQNNNVYVDGQEYGTAQQYYDGAQTLADAGAGADTDATDQQWLPLGVFALTKPDHSSANMDMQLAVSKADIIRGNYTNTVTRQTVPIYGSVDKKTQRACWTVGKDSKTIMETGIYNLTKDEAPALLHFGSGRTEQWMLVRIKQPADASGAGAAPAAPPTQP